MITMEQSEALAVAFNSHSEEIDRLADTVRPIWQGNGHRLKAALEQVAASSLDPRMQAVAVVALERVDWRWIAEAFETVLAG